MQNNEVVLTFNVCPATDRGGGSRCTCFPCRCRCARVGHTCFCLDFGRKFNIMSAPSDNQSPTLPQKIDSRGGLFWCKNGLVVHAGKMNFYLNQPQLTPILGRFAAKWSAFWC